MVEKATFILHELKKREFKMKASIFQLCNLFPTLYVSSMWETWYGIWFPDQNIEYE